MPAVAAVESTTIMAITSHEITQIAAERLMAPVPPDAQVPARDQISLQMAPYQQSR
jgi:hypothetical protein